MPQLTIDVGHKKYPLYIEKGSIKKAGYYIKKAFPKSNAIIISDVNVYKLYGNILEESLNKNSITHEILVLPAGENTKTHEILINIYNQLVEYKTQKSDVIISLGGGVIGDLSGFAASSYLRGVGFVQIPKTLLAQVDSSIGGKVVVNLKTGKNLVGAFYHPSLVIIDTNVLKTLTDDDFAGGMAEVIKTGAIMDEKLFSLICENSSRDKIMHIIDKIVLRCCNIKGDIVHQDELDNDLRMILNFGHTLAHAIEKMPDNIYTHGQAVAIGMVQFAKLGEKMGFTKSKTSDKIKDIVISFGLPYEIKANKKAMIDIMGRDKKNREGKLNLILLKKIDRAFIYKISMDKIGELL